MKRKLFLLMLIIAMIFSFAACGADNSDEPSLDENPSEDVATDYFFSFQSYGENGTLQITENGETSEMDSYGWPIAPGTKVADICDEWGVTEIVPVSDGDTFEGWIEMKETVETDDTGFETYKIEMVSDKLYTTEEVLNSEMPEHNVIFMAKWQSISISEYESIE